jgi:hypothetical protein
VDEKEVKLAWKGHDAARRRAWQCQWGTFGAAAEWFAQSRQSLRDPVGARNKLTTWGYIKSGLHPDNPDVTSRNNDHLRTVRLDFLPDAELKIAHVSLQAQSDCLRH